MKKIHKIARIGLVGLAILAIALFTACPEDDSGSPPKKTPTYTYVLSVDDVTKSMNKDAQTVDLKPVVTTTPKGGTIPNGAFSLTCTTCPTCDLAVNSAGVLTIPAAFGPGDEGSLDYNLTLIWTAGGIGAPIQKNFKLTINRGAIEIDDIKVLDFTLFRKGATDAQRTIDFILYDTLDLPVTADTYRNKVTMTNAGGSGTITVTETDGKLVVAGDPNLAIGSTHTVNVRAHYEGTEMGGLQEITVTVAALTYEVKFFRTATIELTSLKQDVEATDPAVKPVNPNVLGWEFEGNDWYTDAATTAVYAFTTPVTGPLSLYGKYKAVSTSWNANFVVTIANTAEVLENEVVYIRDVTDSWLDYALTKQLNGTWTGIVPVEKISNTFRYRILAVTGANPDLGINATEDPIEFVYNSTMGDDVTVEYTVIEWIRPVFEEGELLKKPAMQTDSWAAAALGPEWVFENFKDTIIMYTTGDSHDSKQWGPGVRAPNVQYLRFAHRETWVDTNNETAAEDSNYAKPRAEGPAKITQNVDATEGHLAAGDDVTLYAWVCRYNDSVEDVRLLIGEQSYQMPLAKLPMNGRYWTKVTYVTKLTAADIKAGKVNVGLSLLRNENSICKFSIDSFSFTKGANGETGVPDSYTFSVDNTTINLTQGETKPIGPNLQLGGNPVATGVITYKCNTCTTCELTIAANNITAPAGAADMRHRYTATAVVNSVTVGTADFTVVVGTPILAYTLTANITIDSTTNPEAEMFAGEVPYLAGSFFGSNWGNSNGIRKLTQVDSSNVWTVTVNNIDIDNLAIKYNIFIGDEDEMSWTVKAHYADLEFTADGTAAVTLTYSVTEWVGRPVALAGNLLGNPAFDVDGTTGWSLNSSGHWDVEGFSTTANNFYPGGDDGDAKNGKIGTSFADANWNGSQLTNGATGTVFQNVPSTGNVPGTSDAYTLAAGVKVKALAWINRKEGTHSSINIVIGKEVISVINQLEGTGWQLAEVEYTLKGDDIVLGNVYFGVRYTASSAGSIMGVDECYLGIVD